MVATERRNLRHSETHNVCDSKTVKVTDSKTFGFSEEVLRRIDVAERERASRLAAKADHFTIEPDHVKPGGWIVRNPRIPGRIELVNAEGCCTCNYYRIWDRCKHSALVQGHG
jgi:hypothetical protein